MNNYNFTIKSQEDLIKLPAIQQLIAEGKITVEYPKEYLDQRIQNSLDKLCDADYELLIQNNSEFFLELQKKNTIVGVEKTEQMVEKILGLRLNHIKNITNLFDQFKHNATQTLLSYPTEDLQIMYSQLSDMLDDLEMCNRDCRCSEHCSCSENTGA